MEEKLFDEMEEMKEEDVIQESECDNSNSGLALGVGIGLATAAIGSFVWKKALKPLAKKGVEFANKKLNKVNEEVPENNESK